MTRERKIEAILAGAFMREGFEVVDGMATMWIGDIDEGEELAINIARLARDIDIALDRISETKR